MREFAKNKSIFTRRKKWKNFSHWNFPQLTNTNVMNVIPRTHPKRPKRAENFHAVEFPFYQCNEIRRRREEKKLKALIRLATTFAKRLSMRCDEEGVGEDIEISIN